MSANDVPAGPNLDRRTTLAWAGALGLALAAGGLTTYAVLHPQGVKGYGLDPDLQKGKTPWPRLMTGDQLRTTSALADFILPAEGSAPAASAIGVHHLIDEWISAPYPQQRADRDLILAGFAWLDKQAAPSFARATATTRTSALDHLAKQAAASTSDSSPFYRRFRTLVIGGYYTTEAGFKDIGYIGNKALNAFPPPSDAVKAALERAYKTQGLPKRTTPWT